MSCNTGHACQVCFLQAVGQKGQTCTKRRRRGTPRCCSASSKVELRSTLWLWTPSHPCTRPVSVARPSVSDCFCKPEHRLFPSEVTAGDLWLFFVFLCELVNYITLCVILRRLLSQVDARNVDGSTPLCDACSSGSLECVRLLLEHGAKANAALTSRTASPLHEACMGGYLINV